MFKIQYFSYNYGWSVLFTNDIRIQHISDHIRSHKKTSNISLNHYSGEDSTTSPIKLSNSYTLDSNMLNWSVICSNVSHTVGSTVNMLRLGAVVKSL